MTQEELLTLCETEEQRKKIIHSFSIVVNTAKQSSYASIESKEELMQKFIDDEAAADKKAFNKAINSAIKSGRTYKELTSLINESVNSQVKKEIEKQIAVLQKQLKALS